MTPQITIYAEGYRDLLCKLHGLYQHTTNLEIPNVKILFIGDSHDALFFMDYDAWAITDMQVKMRWLKSRYKWRYFDSTLAAGMTKPSGPIIFDKGCIQRVEQDRSVQFRKRSEWFRKLPMDIMFLASHFMEWFPNDIEAKLTYAISPDADRPGNIWQLPVFKKGTELTMYIPSLWLRDKDLPLYCKWARHNDLPIYPHLEAKAEKIINRFTLEKTLRTHHSITRRYLLRYYYRSGKITWDQYLKHRNKTTKQMKNDPTLYDL